LFSAIASLAKMADMDIDIDLDMGMVDEDLVMPEIELSVGHSNLSRV
jgi:hypothetical protein